MRICIILSLVLVLLIGCGDVTTVNFVAPSGTKMEINGNRYVWPVGLEFHRPTSAPAEKKYPFTLSLPTDSGLLNIKGELSILGFMVDDREMDSYALANFRLTKEDIARLEKGAGVRKIGRSQGHGKIIYRIQMEKE